MRKVGFSKRRVDPQIVVGLLVDRCGFPLEIACFDGGKSETKTIIPVTKAFQERQGVADLVVVADAGILSAENLKAIDEAGLRFIVGLTGSNPRSQAWRDRVLIVAIGPSAAFRKAITTSLPHAHIAVDPFQLVQLANLCLTRLRQRLVQEHHQRRGWKVAPAWVHRTLLLRGYDTLTERARHRLEEVFISDDPTGELGAARAAKQQLQAWVHGGRH